MSGRASQYKFLKLEMEIDKQLGRNYSSSQDVTPNNFYINSQKREIIHLACRYLKYFSTLLGTAIAKHTISIFVLNIYQYIFNPI